MIFQADISSLLISHLKSSVVREYAVYNFKQFNFIGIWPNIWPTLVNIPCVLGRNIYSAIVE